MKIIDEFKAFIMRGNIFSLAIAVVIGVAFTTLVNTTTETLIQPLIGILLAGKGMQVLNFHVTSAVYLRVGDFLIGVINFLITAAVIFFVFVKPLTKFGVLPSEEKKDVPPPTAPPAPPA